jgi:8-oxo-dGTP pyrophosphatase MutT (NUDIX family)
VRIVVGAAVVRDGRVLAARRTRPAAAAGRWELPGGAVEPGEDEQTALARELREELDLDLPAEAVLGALDDYPTRSGYVITPLVLWGGADPAMAPQPDEVAAVHRVPFAELCRPDSPRFVTIPESPRPVVQMPIGNELVHAPTAAILLQFRRAAIEGTLERVVDYEQPVFAWR